MRKDTRYYVQLSLLGAILVLLGFTPIGSIQLPFMKATTTHIPVIIGAILLDTEAGVVLGVLFGVVSVLRSTFMPNLTSFVFSPLIPVPGTDMGSWKALLVAFVPRILVGVFSALLFKFLKRHHVKDAVNRPVCAVVGSMTNTIGVLGLIYVLFGKAYASAVGVAFSGLLASLLGVVAVNGVGEAIAAGLVVPFVCFAVIKAGLVDKDSPICFTKR